MCVRPSARHRWQEARVKRKTRDQKTRCCCHRWHLQHLKCIAISAAKRLFVSFFSARSNHGEFAAPLEICGCLCVVSFMLFPFHLSPTPFLIVCTIFFVLFSRPLRGVLRSLSFISRSCCTQFKIRTLEHWTVRQMFNCERWRRAKKKEIYKETSSTKKENTREKEILLR